MTLVLHGVPGSPYLRKPVLTAEEKGAPYTIRAMGFGENKSPEYLALHPFGKIPFMEHDGFQLYEAQAIIRYIDAAFDGPALTPADPKAMARMSQVLNIIDWYVMPSLSGGIGFNRIVAPIFQMPVNEAAVAAAVPLARTCLRALEDILGRNRYFAGDQLSLADLAAVCHLDLVQQSPEGAELIAGSPLLAWLDRMAERPSVQKTAMRKMMGLEAAA
ncbi:MAG: glutathione S-transferase family protein [Caulobacterales bacterium]|nr:glutathione S-transferase family protein [Caulobacterales bacterium]